jgi:hypothetical protein
MAKEFAARNSTPEPGQPEAGQKQCGSCDCEFGECAIAASQPEQGDPIGEAIAAMNDQEVLSKMNSDLCDFYRRWIPDGDYFRCKACKRAHIASKADQKFVHASGCPAEETAEDNPWQVFLRILQPLYIKYSRRQGEAEPVAEWYLGTQNDILYIIDGPPCDGNDQPIHDHGPDILLRVPAGREADEFAKQVVELHNKSLTRPAPRAAVPVEVVKRYFDARHAYDLASGPKGYKPAAPLKHNNPLTIELLAAMRALGAAVDAAAPEQGGVLEEPAP